jgi:putative transposase
MVQYRRNKTKGGSYFFTLTLQDRRTDLLVKHVDVLRKSIKKVQLELPFKIEAIVILPEHLHALWKLPTDDENYSVRWQKIKSLFTHEIIKCGVPLKKGRKDEYNLWQHRYWEHTIKDERDFENHVNYIHYNPVKHNLVKQVRDWQYSSFHTYVKNGILPLDWGGNCDLSSSGKFGE